MPESRLDIYIPTSQASGVVRFPSNNKLSKYKVNSIRVVPANESGGVNTLALNNAFGENNSSIFLNLFDSTGSKFFYDAPIQFFNAFIYGTQFRFKPRFLSLSECYIKFYGRPVGVNFSLIIIVSFEE